MTAVLERTDDMTGPPPADLCPIDHDSLEPHEATYGGRKHGAHLSYWSCPNCPYYFTAITAPPKKAPMQRPALTDQHSIVAAFAACKTTSQVERLHPHLRPAQILAIRDEHGGARIQDLRFAETRLRKQLDAEHAPPAEPAPTPPGPEGTPSPADAATPADAAPSGLGALLRTADDSPKARTRKLADKIRADLTALQGLVAADTEQQRAKAAAAEERRRVARAAEAERNQALAEVARIEAQLKAAKEKLRRQKGTTRAPTTGKPVQASALIRQWAKANGHQVGAAGRIPQGVVDAYNTAHGAQQAS